MQLDKTLSDSALSYLVQLFRAESAEVVIFDEKTVRIGEEADYFYSFCFFIRSVSRKSLYCCGKKRSTSSRISLSLVSLEIVSSNSIWSQIASVIASK